MGTHKFSRRVLLRSAGVGMTLFVGGGIVPVARPAVEPPASASSAASAENRVQAAARMKEVRQIMPARPASPEPSGDGRVT